MSRFTGWVRGGMFLSLLVSLRAQPAQPPPVGQLKIEVIQGADQTVHPGAQFHNQIIIAVTDELGRPVPNANVRFTVKSEGRAGAQPLRVDTVTDPNGRASTGTLRANRFEGEYKIDAGAKFYDKEGENDKIPEANKKPAWYKRRSTWIIVASIAAASLAVTLTVRAEQNPSATITTVTPTVPVTHP